MQHATNLPMHACQLITAIVLGAVCASAVPFVALAEPGAEPAAKAAPGGAADVAATRGAGQWIAIDPKTGARVAPTVPVAPHPAFSTSHKGLVQQPAPGGGVMVDLQGRFRSAATVTVGTDGTRSVGCVPPGTTARQEQEP